MPRTADLPDTNSSDSADWAAVAQLVQQGDRSDALAKLDTLHVRHHDQSLAHFRIHCLWFRLGWRLQDPRMVLGQVFPILFAVPVSWVHRYLRIARKAVR